MLYFFMKFVLYDEDKVNTNRDGHKPCWFF